jgi:hypothetical protein
MELNGKKNGINRQYSNNKEGTNEFKKTKSRQEEQKKRRKLRSTFCAWTFEKMITREIKTEIKRERERERERRRGTVAKITCDEDFSDIRVERSGSEE